MSASAAEAVKISSINDRWKGLEAALKLGNAGAVQRRESKRMFFAGFQEALRVMSEEITQIPDEDGVRALESLHQQCQGFCEAVKMGAA